MSGRLPNLFRGDRQKLPLHEEIATFECSFADYATSYLSFAESCLEKLMDFFFFSRAYLFFVDLLIKFADIYHFLIKNN